MKRIYMSALWGLFSLGALALGTCTIAPPLAETEGSMSDEENPEATTPTGAELFTLIAQDDPYQQWAQFPDYQGVQSSAPPHGPTSQVFINSLVASAIDSFDGGLPTGSIIVKENVGTSPDITEAALTVMWKVSGFDPDNNDWFWANMTLDGQIMAEGNIPACAACHGGARANDFVFVHEF